MDRHCIMLTLVKSEADRDVTFDESGDFSVFCLHHFYMSLAEDQSPQTHFITTLHFLHTVY